MKKLLSLFVLLVAIVTGAQAEDTTYDFESGAIADVFTVSASDGVTNSIETISTYEYASGKKFSETPAGSTKLLVSSFGSTKGNSSKFVTKTSFTNISSISFYVASTDRGKTELAVQVSPNADFSSEVTNVLAQTTLANTDFGGQSNGKMKQMTFSGLALNGYVRIVLAQVSTSNNKIMALDNVVITTAAADYVAQPQITVADNAVTLVSATDGAEIYYTTDGTTPTKSSNKYTAPFSITEDVTVSAIAYKGENESEVTTEYCGYDKTFSATTMVRFDDGNFAEPAGKTIEGITFGTDMKNVESVLSVDEYDFTNAIQFGGGSFNSSRVYSFKVAGACKIYIYGASNSSNVRSVNVKAGSMPSDATDGTSVGSNIGGYADVSLYEYNSADPTTIYITGRGGVNYNIYGIKIVFGNENEYTATITSAGYATLALPYAVAIPSGVKAYTGALNAAGTGVKTTEIKDGVIPANTGVVLEGAAGSYTFTETTDAGTATSSLGSTAGAGKEISSETDSYYVLFKDGDNVGFTKVNNATYVIIPSNKAYVVVSGSGSDALSLNFEGEATAVDAIAEANEAEAAPVKVIKNGKLYIGDFNVAGQQVK